MYIYLFLIFSLILLYVVIIYNKLTTRRNIVKDQFSQIEVQLKRRFDLIPTLVEIVKGYSKHETETFTKVVEARNKFNTSKTINDEIKFAIEVKTSLNNIFALAEDYPELKANTNFLKLQEDLKDTENKIAIERQFYNDTVLTYNNLIDIFPSNIIALIFKFKKYDFFETNDTNNVNINF
jgi:LemA protein